MGRRGAVAIARVAVWFCRWFDVLPLVPCCELSNNSNCRMGVCGASEKAARAEAARSEAARAEAIARSAVLLHLKTDLDSAIPASEVTGYALETVGSLLERVAKQELGLHGKAWEGLELEFSDEVMQKEEELGRAGIVQVSVR